MNSWTHYLTVLRYTYGEKTGYQVIGTYTGNDGLWYNGCNYSGEEKYYLHDFYIDYAGLDLPKMYIPNLRRTVWSTDGYGRANQCRGAGSFRAARQSTTSMRRSPPGRAIRGRSSGTPATTPAPTSTSKKLEHEP